MMWRIVLMTATLYILSVETRALEPIEGPLWPQRLSSITSKEVFDSNNLDSHSQRDYPQELYNSDADYDLIFPKLSHDKRALAMIGRWGPFSNIGKQRTPIRSNPSAIDFDGNINTQTRARMPGQPLRWG